MQTFLPLRSFKDSARVLDRSRLGKQRVEVLQLLNGTGWTNHPCYKMWVGYRPALIIYGLCICLEWTGRGYKDSVTRKLLDMSDDSPVVYPPWLGLESFHASHRSNLLRKDPIHYGQFKWVEPDNLPYVWPT